MGAKVLSIIGGRPQMAMALVSSLAFEQLNQKRGSNFLTHDILCLGQKKLQFFFQNIQFPTFCRFIEKDGASQIHALSRLMFDIGQEMDQNKPDVVLIYGVGNSSLAGSLAAVKRNLPIIRLGAGLRFCTTNNQKDFYRHLIDKLATWRLCPTESALENLQKENLAEKAFLSGDFLHEALQTIIHFQGKDGLLPSFSLLNKQYLLVSVHQAENMASQEKLRNIAKALKELSQTMPVLWLGNPFLMEKLIWFSDSDSLRLIEPVTYLESLALLNGAKVVLTDSGAMLREAIYQKTPVVTLSDRFDWPEFLKEGQNFLAGSNSRQIVSLALAATKCSWKKTNLLEKPHETLLSLLEEIF